MQQRRLRLGDVLDDYCPRERRITNHAVVAMIGEEVRQTRCTTCDAEHEYKHARVPPARRKKPDVGTPDVAEGTLRARTSPEEPELPDEGAESGVHEESFEMTEPLELAPESEPAGEVEAEPTSDSPAPEDEGPVHRRLIRATLPRPEGQAPERKTPEFTIRQPGSRGGRDFDGNRNGHRHGRRGARPQGGGSGGGGQSSRFGGQGPRQGSGQGSRSPGQGQRQQGNRPGHGNRGGGRPGQGGQGRGGGR